MGLLLVKHSYYVLLFSLFLFCFVSHLRRRCRWFWPQWLTNTSAPRSLVDSFRVSAIFCMSVSQLLIVQYMIVLLTAFLGYMYVSGLYNHSKCVLNLADSKILGKLVEKKAQSRLYISSLIVLWMSLTSSFIFGWVESTDAFVINNNSPVDVLAALETFTNDTPGVMVLVYSSYWR